MCAASAQTASDGALDAGMSERIRSTLGAAVLMPGGPVRLEFEIGRLDPRLRLAPCRRIETHLPHQAPLWGRTRVGLRCVDGEKLWNVTLPVTVKVFAPALVVAAALPAGTQILAQHLGVAEVDLAAEASPALQRAEEALGRTLARPLTAGSTLRAGDLRQRQWFAAGDTVQVVARGAGFVVIGEGQAVSAGIEGQPAKVRTESGRILSAQPVAERRVELSL